MLDFNKMKTSRLKEMYDFGYTWYGMYPLRTLEEINDAVTQGLEIYELRNDSTESLATDEDLSEIIKEKENGDIMVGVDISDFLYFLSGYDVAMSKRGFSDFLQADIIKSEGLITLMNGWLKREEKIRKQIKD